MNFREWLNRERTSKREEYIKEHGKDPKTGLTMRKLELTDKVRPRGGKNSRRRTTLVWGSAEKPGDS